VIGKHSSYRDEHEVLIPRTDSTKHKFHIEYLGTDTYDDAGGKVYVHKVKRVPASEITKH
jgi:hypothetical protein